MASPFGAGSSTLSAFLKYQMDEFRTPPPAHMGTAGQKPGKAIIMLCSNHHHHDLFLNDRNPTTNVPNQSSISSSCFLLGILLPVDESLPCPITCLWSVKISVPGIHKSTFPSSIFTPPSPCVVPESAKWTPSASSSDRRYCRIFFRSKIFTAFFEFKSHEQW